MRILQPAIARRCKDCAAFDPKGDQDAGLCKAHSPNLYIFPMPVNTLQGQGIIPQEFTGWPVVNTTNWCLDFVQNPITTLNS